MTARLLFQIKNAEIRTNPISNTDVSPDRSSFAFVLKGGERSPRREITVVLNWAEELKRLAARRKK